MDSPSVDLSLVFIKKGLNLKVTHTSCIMICCVILHL